MAAKKKVSQHSAKYLMDRAYILRKKGYHPTKTYQPETTKRIARRTEFEMVNQPGYKPGWAKPIAPPRRKA